MTITELKKLLSGFQSKITDKEITWTLPTDLEHGILTTNIAFTLAKELRQNPNKIAEELSAELNQFIETEKLVVITSKPICAYINIIPTESFFKELLNSNLNKENLVIKSDIPVMLEYVSTNVAKKIHAGHMRNCNIGEALRRILSLKYTDILTDNHWGDWGVNMGVLIWGYKNFPENNKPQHPNIDQLTDYYVWGNNQKDKVEGWEEKVRNEFLGLELKSDFNYNFWLESIKESKKDAIMDLALLNVRPHDLNQGESFYDKDIDCLHGWMKYNNICSSEGMAIYFDFDNLVERWHNLDEKTKKQISKLGRAYMISSTGYSSYCFRDVAARWQWARDHKREIMITLTDKTQNHVITQAFAIISFISQMRTFREISDIKPIKFENLINVAYGFLKLPEGKMSTRTGNVLLLRDLFNQVQDEAKKSILSKNENNINKFDTLQLEDTSKKLTVAALKWNDLKQSYEQDITFDINQVLNFVGNTGVYQLYTYARLNSVLKKLKNLNPSFKSESFIYKNPITIKDNSKNIKLLDQIYIDLNPLEQSILKQIWTLPEVLESICENYQIHLLTNHLYMLSNLVNKWYNDVPILKDARSDFMLIFIIKVIKHLEFCLDLLGIEVVEEI